jgi:hypothetical protein
MGIKLHVWLEEKYREPVSVPWTRYDMERIMIYRYLSLWFGLLLWVSLIFFMQGCTQTKVYELAKPDQNTATLTFPEFIEINELDNESVQGLFSQIIYEGQKEIIFPAGTHTVELRYYGMWDIDDDDHENVISRYVVLQFDAKPGVAYKVQVDAPKDRKAAHELASHFNPSIVETRTGACVSRLVNE